MELMSGVHLIIDITNINDISKLMYENETIMIMDKLIEKYNLKVVKKAIHQFEPFGVTGVYVLSESHLSIHTFVEEKKVAMDLYTCSNTRDFNDIVNYIKLLYDDDNCIIRFKVIKR